MTQQNPNSVFLDEVIECVKEVGSKQQQTQNKLQSLYGQAGELIKNFETNINRCKRYNQAKINRKYEMIIQQLQGQVRKLNQKLRIEQDARSPTKKHITDILDQLVVYKDQNEQLRKQIQQYKKIIQQVQNKNELQAAAIKKMQITQPKALVQRLPALNVAASMTDSIKQYLKDKQNVRRVVANSQKSNFQKFLHQIQTKSWNWTLGNLFQEIDKWAEGIKPNKQVDMWKIRSSVARSFCDYLDDSQTLTRPASFTKNILNPIGSSIASSSRRELVPGKKSLNRFSVFGDRREKSLILDTSNSNIH